MNTLTEKAYANLKLLLDMKENDSFISKRGELILNDEFVQVDNLMDMEYTIYFTYHQLLTSSTMGVFLNTDLIKKLDESLDMIFENKQFEELLEEDGFKCIMDDIDLKLDTLKESYFYKSPFFTLWRNSYNVYDHIKNIMNENNEHICRMFQINMYSLNKDINRDYYSDDDSDDDNTNEEDELDKVTGESNPNLIYEQVEQAQEEEDNKKNE